MKKKAKPYADGVAPPPDTSSLPLVKGLEGVPITNSYKAYQYWMAHPTTSITDIAAKMRVGPEGLREFIKRHKLPRPDGRSGVMEKTPRQAAIEKAYKMAVKKGWHAKQAANWVVEQTGQTCGRGEIQYWAMKNNLPYLPEPPSMANKFTNTPS